MAFDTEGLLDFGSGAFQGGQVGAKVSGGNPIATAGGALALGALSYFGGQKQRKMESKYNDKALAQMDQDLELGDLKISEARRQKAKEIERQQQMQRFGALLGQYFQKQGGG